MKSVRVKLLRSGAKLPAYGSDGAAGADLYACLSEPIEILPGKSVFVPTGISMEIPEGFAGLIYARSGLACKRGLAPANKVGVIDSDYRGEVMVPIHNHSAQTQQIAGGERIAQMVIMPYIKAEFLESDTLDQTDRAQKGFGSTGVK